MVTTSTLRRLVGISSLVALFFGGMPSVATSTEIGFNLYGLSYHTDRDAAESLDFNEVNLGFGFQVAFLESKVGQFLGDGGFFKDTFRETAGYIALGYKLKITEALRAGILVSRYTSISVNDGNSLIAPVPVVSIRLGFICANFVYMAAHEPVNRFSWFGAYLTLYAAKKKSDAGG